MAGQTTLIGEPSNWLWMKSEKGKIVGYAECGPTPPGEIVTRSAYCNLRCIPCFAYSYSWPEEAFKNKDVIKVPLGKIIAEVQSYLKNNRPIQKDSYNWFRIVGGEPFLSEACLELYIDFISKIGAEDCRMFGNRVLVQTNGIILGKLTKEDLLSKFKPISDKNLKIILEISIKGSNPQEFGVITQCGKEGSKTLYEQHIRACDNLEHVHSHISNIDWTAVAGFGIGVTNLKSGHLKNLSYIKTFYHPDTNKPFYHPDNWDSAFQNLFSRHIEKYREKFDTKFPMFGIEDRPKWKSCLHGLRRSSKLGGKHYYDRFTTNKNNPNPELEKHMEEIIKYFFFGDPSVYYVKLFE